MSSSDAGEFIANLMSNLNKNGYPEKKVSFPLQKLAESAKNKGLNIEKILEFLEQKEIFSKHLGEKIIFMSKAHVDEEVQEDQTQSQTKKEAEQSSWDFQNIANMDMSQLMSKATDALKHMPPEQIENLKSMMGSMSQDQMDSVKNMFDNMSSEQKQKVTDQVKDALKK